MQQARLEVPQASRLADASRVSVDIRREYYADVGPSPSAGSDAELRLRTAPKLRLATRILFQRFWKELVVFLIAAALAGIAVAFAMFDRLHYMAVDSVHLYCIFGWAAIAVGSTLVFGPVAWLVSLGIQRSVIKTDPSSDFHSSFKLYLTLGGVGALLVGINHVLFKDLPEDRFFYLHRTTILVTIIGFSRAAILFGQELVIISINRTTMWEKVYDHLFQNKVVKILSKGTKVRVHRSHHSSPSVLDDEIPVTPRPNPTEANPWWMPRRKQEKPSQIAFQNAVRKITAEELFLLSTVFPRTSQDDPPAASLRAAVQILHNLDTKGRGYFTKGDVMPYFVTTERAERAFAMFDRFGCGQVTVEDVSAVLLKMLSEHSMLLETLLDRRDIADIIDRIILVLFWFVVILCAIPLYGKSISSLLLPLSTSFLGFSFVFGGSLKSLYESIIVIFVIRPFDRGDRIKLLTTGTLIVGKMNLLTTEARTPDGQLYIIPNSTLFSSIVVNYKRGTDFCLNAILQFSAETPQHLIDEFEKRMAEFYRTDTRAPWVPDSFVFWSSGIQDMTRMTYEIWIQVRGITWQYPSKYNRSKTLTYTEAKRICLELGITCLNTAQPVLLSKATGDAAVKSTQGSTALDKQHSEHSLMAPGDVRRRARKLRESTNPEEDDGTDTNHSLDDFDENVPLTTAIRTSGDPLIAASSLGTMNMHAAAGSSSTAYQFSLLSSLVQAPAAKRQSESGDDGDDLDDHTRGPR
eukprot:m51a1_g9375 hypothetical protein (748) ;mRNA; f:200281-202887